MSKSAEGNQNAKGAIRSEEYLQKQRLSHSGEKCYAWKGGVNSINAIIRRSFRYRQWRSDIFTRDDFTCQRCYQYSGWLEAHHIISFTKIVEKYKIKTIEEALECEELWNINNGITLCKKCHNKTKWKTK